MVRIIVISSKVKIASNDPIPLAAISQGSECVLAPHSGLSSSNVNIIKITVELRITIKRLYLGCLIKTAFTNARLIR